jgi:hypothetical protein
MKPIICLDFDGVIHSYISGWQGARSIPDPPVEGALEFMAQALRLGYDVVIHSSRARYWGGIRAMRQWLRSVSGSMWYEGGFDVGLEDVRFTRWKPAAIVTLDDRAVRFDGTFPKPQELVALKPWNKMGRI